ncbi:hypothetical protein CVT26_000440 [Gymnopilus dilepis]|uniref:GST N-terminal domain-containing protein n=1 Tax=Gymnopilus dilepis TaxID=231916 RepID=A0A409Y2D6_9AGAR|nr:hypothetical protein CVT26_000440 [Gymnopilus dilepis]
MLDLITLHAAKICPWAHRVELALKESKLPYKRYEVDLAIKPEWYAPLVSPASEIPAIAYGAPNVPPYQPLQESARLAESYTLLAFVANLSEV